MLWWWFPAVVMLTTACLGTFMGGVLSRRFKMGPLASLKFSALMQLLSSAGNVLQMAFTCQQPPLYNSPGCDFRPCLASQLAITSLLVIQFLFSFNTL